jgi:hypothetical protein
MNFLTRPETPFDRDDLRAHVLDAWRGAEELVAIRWRAYLDADSETRAAAFAAYVAALDIEEAAADELWQMSLPEAA